MSTGPAAVLAWTGAATTLIAGLSLLGTGVIAQSRAATAADLASLAGADAAAVAHARPCAVAVEVAARNGARLLRCAQSGADVLVTVEVAASPLPPATARSRAGPGPIDPP